MKITMYAGTFLGKSKLQKVIEGLESSGLNNNQITAYQNFQNNPEMFAVCVSVNNDHECQKTEDTFTQFDSPHLYKFDEMLSEQELAHCITLVAKAAVTEASQQFSPRNKSNYHEGMSSEVIF